MKQDFVEEMQYLSKLRHPCVTTIMGAVLGKDPMLVMEVSDSDCCLLVVQAVAV